MCSRKRWFLAFQLGSALTVLLLAGCASSGSRTVQQSFNGNLNRFKSADVEVTSAVAKPPARFSEFVVQLENRIIADLRSRRLLEKIYSHAADPDNKAEMNIRVVISDVRDVDNFNRIMWGAFAGQANTKATVEVRDRSSDTLLGSVQIEGKSSGGSVFAGTTTEAIDRVADQVVDVIAENW